jgi:O-antigen/teichoic acid export membrane protein
VLTLPVGVGLSLVAAPLVALAFGPQWEQAVPVLRILSLSSIVMVFGLLSLHMLSAHALLGRLVGTTLAGATIRIALLALLIPRFGLTGAALGAGAAVVLEQVFTVLTAMRRFHIDAARMIRRVWRSLAAAGAMAAVLAASGLGWSADDSVSTLVEAVACGGATYVAVLLASWRLAGRPEGAETDLLALLRIAR